MLVFIANGKATDDHVGVPNGLHFVHIVISNDRVEARIQIVQEINHLNSTKKKQKKNTQIINRMTFPVSIKLSYIKVNDIEAATCSGLDWADISVNPTISLK